MVEVEGERTLAASCIREPVTEGMVVHHGRVRARRARPARWWSRLLPPISPRGSPTTPRRISPTWRRAQGVTESRFPDRKTRQAIPLLDDSHVAMRVNLDACIHCNLCVRACREVQVNDVIGMAGRGAGAQIVFDQGRPDGRLNLRRLRRMRAGLSHRRPDARDCP